MSVRHGNVADFLFYTFVSTTLTRDEISNDLIFTGEREKTGSDDELENFKLSLMEPDLSRDERSDPKLVEFIRHQVFDNAPPEISPTDTVSGFLKGLWDMVYGRLSDNCRGPHLLNVAITYPACWDEGELGRLKKAVVKAGVPSPAKYVSEQKAATYGILHEYKTKISQDLKVRVSACATYCPWATLTRPTGGRFDHRGRLRRIHDGKLGSHPNLALRLTQYLPPI